jgi:hypothetical protein
MMKAKEASLGRECHVFFQYLCDLKIDPYIVAKYCEAHRKVPAYTPSPGFDHLLVRFATLRSSFTRMADCYSRFFAPRSALRKKLILLIAILESSSAASVFVDTIDTQNKLLLSGRLLLQAITFLANLGLGAALLLPCRLVYTLIPRKDGA